MNTVQKLEYIQGQINDLQQQLNRFSESVVDDMDRYANLGDSTKDPRVGKKATEEDIGCLVMVSDYHCDYPQGPYYLQQVSSYDEDYPYVVTEHPWSNTACEDTYKYAWIYQGPYKQQWIYTDSAVDPDSVLAHYSDSMVIVVYRDGDKGFAYACDIAFTQDVYKFAIINMGDC